MENRRGSGIFLGVVGVATLIVAIIGATFAYFSASATADETVNLQAYEFNATLTLTQVSGAGAQKLIPMNPDGTVTVADGATVPGGYDKNLLYAVNVAECLNDGFKVCAVYKATITNNGTAPLTLAKTLITTTNTPGSYKDAAGFTNLKYLELGGNEGSTTEGLKNEFAVAKVGEPGALTDMTPITINPTVGQSTSLGTIVVPAKGGESPNTADIYFVVYLNDVATEGGNNPEMGSNFVGTLTYTDSGLTSNQLTATFKVAA
jgi:hypothetical protein